MHPMNEVLRASMDSIDTMVDRNRVLVADDSSELRAIVRDAAKHDYRMSAFIKGIVKSQAFMFVPI